MSLKESCVYSRWRMWTGLLVIVLAVVLAGCNSSSSQTSNSTTAEPTTPTEATTTTTSEPATPPKDAQASTEPTTPSVEPTPPTEEVQLVVAYVRPGVQPNQHYVKVEETLAGPTPCNPDSLLVVLENTGLALQWQPEERLEIYGAYQTDDGGCRVSLNQPQHTVKSLPKPEPEPTVELEPQPQTIRLTGTVSTVRDQTAFLIVDRVIDGTFECDQASILMADTTTIAQDAQYEITALYDPANANCQLRLVNPAVDLHLLTPPAPVATPEVPVAPTTPATPVTPGAPKNFPFFVSGGVSLVEQIPVFLGSGGFGLADHIKGMLTAGMGTGQLDLALPSGEPISAAINITLIEAAGLYNVAGDFYVGASGGVMLIAGDFHLPYPVSGSTKFNTTIPIAGVVLGYDLGFAMATISVGMALGG